MAKKFYAVKEGYQIGIYDTWTECQKQIKGYSGAEYKGFSTEEEAKAYLGVTDDNSCSIEDEIIDGVVAYIVGSYDDRQKAFSYGIVIINNGIEEYLSEKLSDKNLVTMRNVAGEIAASKKIMQYCIDNIIPKVMIYYDYEGIMKWCTGEWKAREIGTKSYAEFYISIKDKLEVNFTKIKTHTNNKYNDLADKLAKSALGLEKCPCIKETPYDMTANNICLEELKAIFELVQEDNNEIKITSCKAPYGQRFLLTLKTPKIQNLTVIHYDDKNKLTIQGKKEELFNLFSTYLVELLTTDEVSEYLNTVHNLQIDKTVVEDDFSKYLPHACTIGRIPDKLNSYLHQAVYNLRINGEVYNATFLVEPAIRPLEGILKIALEENNIPIRESTKKHDNFFVFKKSNNRYRLKQEYKNSEQKESFINYIEKCYAFFHQYRHVLFHWDDPLEDLDTTRVINTTNEAHTIIKDILKIIDEYYSL
ncbi:MAG: type II toxin-antitoxin system RnlA family toxin [Clostridiales bacterium]|nr:type II toxin-antitoxin system RnlA family toxin [Clostridiales bacterium]